MLTDTAPAQPGPADNHGAIQADLAKRPKLETAFLDTTLAGNTDRNIPVQTGMNLYGQDTKGLLKKIMSRFCQTKN